MRFIFSYLVVILLTAGSSRTVASLQSIVGTAGVR